MKKKKRIKKLPLLFLILIILIPIIIFINKDNKKEKTENIKKTTTKETVKEENTLENKLKKEKYYINNNLDRYLKYYENHNDLSLDKIIANVNSNLDKTRYEDTKETDISKNELMLVNKYYYLTENYIPNDLIVLNSKYNTGVNSNMRKIAADAFMEMSDAALLDNIIIKNASAYRSYNYQVNLYNNYVQRDGKEAADTYSARPGFSEHQTGLASDINLVDSSFENTDAFKWLDKNAYKYGFILRFPKDKEDITGYKYESWHYRYVGKDIAKKIKEENLTLEEYYAYYVEKN